MLFMAMPAIAVLLMALVVFRHFLRIDEFLRRELVESFAAAAAVTFIWTMFYGVCELAGFPRISIWWIWGGMTVVMNLWLFGKRMFVR